MYTRKGRKDKRYYINHSIKEAKMGSEGYILVREIENIELWEEKKEEFYEYIKKYGKLNVYVYDNFMDSGKKVLIVYKGDCPADYGFDSYLVFPELFDIDKEIEEYKEILLITGIDEQEVEQKTKEKFSYYFEFMAKFAPMFGKPFKYKIWT